MTTYEPGTVAKATVRGVPDVTVFRRGLGLIGDDWAHDATEVGYSCSNDDEVTDVRPLVLLDFASAYPYYTNALGDLVNSLRAGDRTGATWNAIADQIEAQVNPSRIPEPTDPLTEVMASTDGRERRKFIRGYTGPGGSARWVDGVWGYSWDGLIDPTLVREGVES